MNRATKLAIVERANERRAGLSDQKGAEYTQLGEDYQNDDVDCLANFKSVAERFGISPLMALGVYMGKHFDSIETFIAEIGKMESYEQALLKTVEGEGIISRLDDARNYLDLMEALLAEYYLHPEMLEDQLAALSEQLDEEPDGVAPEEFEGGGDDVDPQPGPVSVIDLPVSPFRGERDTGVG